MSEKLSDIKSDAESNEKLTKQAHTKINVDDLYKVIGEIGKYQFTLLCLVGLISSIPAFVVYSYIFTGATPRHRCKLDNYINDTYDIQSPYHEQLVKKYVPLDENGSYKKCVLFKNLLNESLSSNETYRCRQHVFSKEYYHRTAVTQWNWVCSNTKLKSLFSTLLFVGLNFVIVVGTISDRYGRKKALTLCLVLNVLTNYAIAFITMFMNDSLRVQQIVFGILRLLSGVSSAFYSCSFVLGMEMVGPKYRATAGSSFYYFYIMGELLNVAIGYFLRDFSHHYVFLSLLLTVMCCSLWFVPESPRYLFVKGKREQAYKTFLKMAKSNNKEQEFLDLTQKSEHLALLDDTSSSNTERPSFLKIVKVFISSKKLIMQTVATIINWVTNSFVYYGISLNTGSLAGNPYINASFAALVEFVGVALCHFLISKFGRKYPYAIFMFISGASLVTIQFFVEMPTIVTILALICKLSISFTYSACYIVTAETYPTIIRATIMTLCSSISRFGPVIAPFVQDLGEYSFSLPFIIFGCASLVATIFHIAFVPETKAKNMKDNLHEFTERKKSNTDP